MNRNPVIATYDIWSTTYDTHLNPLIPIEELTTRSLLRTLPCHHVLDAATGTGRYALYFAKQGKRVTAADASRRMLAEAKAKAKREKLVIDFQRKDIADLSFDDGLFDLVICALALSHQPDLVKPSRELVRVLRRGGNLIITDLHPWFQAKCGSQYEIELEGERYAYPLCYTGTDDYVHAVKLSGAEVLAVLDVPSRWIPPEGEHVAVPGAMILWAKKSK